MDDQNLTQRAMRAYFRAGGEHVDQPSRSSGVETAENGRAYVVLRGGTNSNGICAVFRVTPDETLKRLKRWPGDLE